MRLILFLVVSAFMASSAAAANEIDFEREIRPLLIAHCVKCHGPEKQEGGLRLDARKFAFQGGDSGSTLVPGKSGASELVRRISSTDDERMPPEGTRLTRMEIERIQRWIDAGATWPETADDRAAEVDPRLKHWSWSKLERPAVPDLSEEDNAWSRSPVDRFIMHQLRERGLAPSREADRRTLMRRLYFDLIGLPPAPEDVVAFERDEDPRAYERVVDRLLASPQYGERWARHWLDVVHYGDTHGYDKDQPRPDAWPYRDYVIRAFNQDKPYGRFLEEQIAGDVLFPNTVDGVEALGFIAAGPWDLIGHAEVPETKIDGKIARLLDRDDMVSNTMNTFASLTVQCARCHNHKFDPISQHDYYSLQAVFAALDRAPKAYDVDPAIAQRRGELRGEQQALTNVIAAARGELDKSAMEKLAALEAKIKELQELKPGTKSTVAAFGYHSQLATTADTVKWVQLDLAASVPLSRIVLQPAHDNFNNIGAGFGFPVRFKVELSNDPRFAENVVLVADYTERDFANPGLTPLEIPINLQPARHLRVTATKLAPRQNDFHLALAEFQAFDADGRNVALAGSISALDSIEAPPRWLKSNLLDRYYPGENLSSDPRQLEALRREREDLISASLSLETRAKLIDATQSLDRVTRELASLPPEKKVYAGTIHTGSGAFSGTGGQGGKPRAIHVLRRGNVLDPREEVGPGTVTMIPELVARFELPATAAEGERRAALARWLSDERNPLTWRSIVNRVWQYHFGRGLVDSPNDFGRMGQPPSNQPLLDWLAVEFRDGGQSFKSLHRLIVTSAVYRQASTGNATNQAIDGGNNYWWRMNRRRLEAEEIRDAVLSVAGKMSLAPGGPGYQDFVIEHPAHSPHYEYHLHDPNDVKTHRRSIYRFIVRSQPQPFLTTLDCADPSMSVDKRNESLTALQALALLNNRFMITMADHFARRLQAEQPTLDQQIERGFQLALGRTPTIQERDLFTNYAREHGLASACRAIFNLTEFVFVD